VGSYPTVSPLPFGYKGGLFSVALPSPRGAQVLPGGLPCGARTFLDWPLKPANRDHRPHHFQREEKYRAPGGVGKALFRKTADYTREAV
jgi:hypothetical protein